MALWIPEVICEGRCETRRPCRWLRYFLCALEMPTWAVVRYVLRNNARSVSVERDSQHFGTTPPTFPKSILIGEIWRIYCCWLLEIHICFFRQFVLSLSILNFLHPPASRQHNHVWRHCSTHRLRYAYALYGTADIIVWNYSGCIRQPRKDNSDYIAASSNGIVNNKQSLGLGLWPRDILFP